MQRVYPSWNAFVTALIFFTKTCQTLGIFSGLSSPVEAYIVIPDDDTEYNVAPLVSLTDPNPNCIPTPNPLLP